MQNLNELLGAEINEVLKEREEEDDLLKKTKITKKTELIKKESGITMTT